MAMEKKLIKTVRKSAAAKCRMMRVIVLASKYHRDEQTLQVIDDLKKTYPNLQESAAASSLKILQDC